MNPFWEAAKILLGDNFISVEITDNIWIKIRKTNDVLRDLGLHTYLYKKVYKEKDMVDILIVETDSFLFDINVLNLLVKLHNLEGGYLRNLGCFIGINRIFRDSKLPYFCDSKDGKMVLYKYSEVI